MLTMTAGVGLVMILRWYWWRDQRVERDLGAGDFRGRRQRALRLQRRPGRRSERHREAARSSPSRHHGGLARRHVRHPTRNRGDAAALLRARPPERARLARGSRASPRPARPAIRSASPSSTGSPASASCSARCSRSEISCSPNPLPGSRLPCSRSSAARSSRATLQHARGAPPSPRRSRCIVALVPLTVARRQRQDARRTSKATSRTNARDAATRSCP